MQRGAGGWVRGLVRKIREYEELKKLLTGVEHKNGITGTIIKKSTADQLIL